MIKVAVINLIKNLNFYQKKNNKIRIFKVKFTKIIKIEDKMMSFKLLQNKVFSQFKESRKKFKKSLRNLTINNKIIHRSYNHKNSQNKMTQINKVI